MENTTGNSRETDMENCLLAGRQLADVRVIRDPEMFLSVLNVYTHAHHLLSSYASDDGRLASAIKSLATDLAPRRTIGR